MINILNKDEVVNVVKKKVGKAKKEILATMLLSEEILSPLPDSYHALLVERVNSGVVLKRIGFGTKKDYTIIKSKYLIESNRYKFKYITNIKKYQRMIIIDKQNLFFGVNGTFFHSAYKPLVIAFRKYFKDYFMKGKYE